ncbi:MAG: YlbF family regulator [Defluviitaleaceae bacterium]|nr:YlbF family regulator [Defluviitaleaceae bacterium]
MTESEILFSEAEALATRLAKSRLYGEYRRLKAEIDADPALSRRMSTYKQTHVEHEKKRMLNTSVSFEDEQIISHMYTALRMHDIAGPFLRAEEELLVLYSRIYETITEACDIPVPI